MLSGHVGGDQDIERGHRAARFRIDWPARDGILGPDTAGVRDRTGGCVQPAKKFVVLELHSCLVTKLMPDTPEFSAHPQPLDQRPLPSAQLTHHTEEIPDTNQPRLLISLIGGG